VPRGDGGPDEVDPKKSSLVGEETLKMLLETSGLDPMTLAGVSGAGKTRAAFEFLSCQFGIYLACPTGAGIDLQQGDMGAMIDTLQQYLRDVPEMNTKNNKATVLRLRFQLAAHLIRCVLVSRWTVLRALQTKYGASLKPVDWLVAQLHPSQLASGDVFTDLYRTLICEEPSIVKATLEEYRRDFVKHLARVCVCLDEAQVLLGAMDFPSPSLAFDANEQTRRWSGERTLLSVFLRVFRQTAIIAPVVLGTGVSMTLLQKELGSGVAKAPMAPVKFKALTGEEVCQYVGRFLNKGASENEQAAMRETSFLHLVRGRARFSAGVVATALCSKDGSVVDAVEEFVASMTTVPNEAA
jgi:hypothetical protein